MKAKMKRGKIEVIIEYDDYAMEEVEKVAEMLKMSPIHACIVAHRLMLNLMANEPSAVARYIQKFEEDMLCFQSH